jgi:hypothetical protein
MMLKGITPDWPAPPWVKAYTTTRLGGHSISPYDSFNLADHVGDDPINVAANREQLIHTLNLPSAPLWLTQVHGCCVVAAEASQVGKQADAAYTDQKGQVCAVLTADCLPVLFCDRAGTRVAVAHAGWRGLAAGILEATVRHLEVPPSEILVWLGPAIGPHAFEVGDEVREAFITTLPQAALAFTAHRYHHWLADLYLLARQRLAQHYVTAVYGGNYCTYTDSKHFYSYRRDNVTGRMATLIWLVNNNKI